MHDGHDTIDRFACCVVIATQLRVVLTGTEPAPIPTSVFPRRSSLIIRAATALGMVALQLFLLGHMALEQHTLSVSGAVVEVHDSFQLHGHEDRSLCEREAADDAGRPDVPCQGTPEALRLVDQRSPVGPVLVHLTSLVRAQSPEHHLAAVWLMAPKASPPAQRA